METMIENLVNGNVSTARKQARRHSQDAIYRGCMGIGWSESRSYAAALFLKTGDGFQRYCDAD